MEESAQFLEGQIANLAFLENIYQNYQAKSIKLNEAWLHFFQAVEKEGLTTPVKPGALPLSETERIERLADAYRRYGHLIATINPIALEQPQELYLLKLDKLGFSVNEEEVLFPTLGLLPQAQAPLKAIVAVLGKRYAQDMGFEFKGFTDLPLEQWMQQQIESGVFSKPLSLEEKRLVLRALNDAEFLETFLHTKHVGKKRFSLEGGEILIPMLRFLCATGAEEGIEEIYIGMSHRGRINVLANILNKSLQEILKDFDEDYVPLPLEGMGDIRYHKGHANESVHTYQGKTIHVNLTPNPSHLESVNPVVEGQTHAKQFLVHDEGNRRRIIPLLMHGDASLAGQGLVYETLQLSKLHGYETGGTLHLVINNQIGFTTSPKDARSTPYCTDIAHTFGAPVIHVNAENPESCIRALMMALEIRQKFHSDVFIDLNCYRKYGHNEGDEPAFTQPLEYQLIRQKRSIRELYRDLLLRENVITEKEANEEEKKLKKNLQVAYAKAQEKDLGKVSEGSKESPLLTSDPKTSVDDELLKMVTERFSIIPPNFHPHPKLENLIKERARSIKEDKPLDWGLAEFLAYATLLWEGTPVRLSGQDSGRGTFSHRHALWVDQQDEKEYFPLSHLREGQGRFEVLNSCLSEAAVLGFEYGYSVICSMGLTIWEAQFGDFANSAQVIIDQYIASGEQKWGQTSGLVLFLPHGFEGQGPEHSSARLERFLTLAGHGNMQVVNPTTPAQLFHLLRRQVNQSSHKPLVVMTPKGLLRHQACTSRLKDFTEGRFFPLLDDPRQMKKVNRVVLCSGRIYYDLDAQRMKDKREDVALIRIEQLYPLDEEGLKTLLARYVPFHKCLWVQEEPENMGAWSFISAYLPRLLPAGVPLAYIGRERSASPATGFYARHQKELSHIFQQVFEYEK